MPPIKYQYIPDEIINDIKILNRFPSGRNGWMAQVECLKCGEKHDLDFYKFKHGTHCKFCIGWKYPQIKQNTIKGNFKFIGYVDKKCWRQKINIECMTCNEIRDILVGSFLNNKYIKCFTCEQRELLSKYVNKKFGFLTAKKLVTLPNFKHRHSWECQCVCGDICLVPTTFLVNGKITSCGCRGATKFDLVGDISSIYFNHIRRNAAKRNFSFDITREYAMSILIKQNHQCAYSGETLIFNYDDRSTHTASMDRINSSLGYVEGNIQWVHKLINKIKMNIPHETFIDLCCKISDYQRSKNRVNE